MEKHNRKIALALALVVFIAMLFSSFYIAAEAGHDCAGEHCPICCQISVCKNTLKSLGCGVFAAVSCIALTFCAVILLCRPQARLIGTTLITLKVKLSN